MSRKFALLAGASFLIISTSAFAQDAAPEAVAAKEDTGGLEEIVVTAQKREENLQDVPVSVTALSAESLANNRIADFTDLTRAASSLTVTQATSSPKAIARRGVTSAQGEQHRAAQHQFLMHGFSPHQFHIVPSSSRAIGR